MILMITTRVIGGCACKQRPFTIFVAKYIHVVVEALTLDGSVRGGVLSTKVVTGAWRKQTVWYFNGVPLLGRIWYFDEITFQNVLTFFPKLLTNLR